jgi:hypothetical protein
MTPTTSHEVTALLLAWSEGDRGALDRPVSSVYADPRSMSGPKRSGATGASPAQGWAGNWAESREHEA